MSARSQVGGSPGVRVGDRGWEAAREADTLPGSSQPSPLLGLGARRASHAPTSQTQSPGLALQGHRPPRGASGKTPRLHLSCTACAGAVRREAEM